MECVLTTVKHTHKDKLGTTGVLMNVPVMTQPEENTVATTSKCIY